MDLVARAGQLKPMLVEFATSPRYESEMSLAFARQYPDGFKEIGASLSMAVDHFALQHKLPSGKTVVEEFVAQHPELSGEEQDMLLGWRDVVEGIFEITGKDRGALMVFCYLDELTYRVRSNLGSQAMKPLRKGMILIGRLVRAGPDWMVSGNLSTLPASARGTALEIAAEQAQRNPKAVFRNPANLARAQLSLKERHEAFVDLFGDDLIVVPGSEVPARFEAFWRYMAQLHAPDVEYNPPPLDAPPELLAASSVAIYFAPGYGMSFHPGYDLLDELFSQPALISRQLYQEVLSGYLNDRHSSPEPLRRLAARDPHSASTVFTRFLGRKGGFSWDTDGEDLLRQHKPSYFDGTELPHTVVLSPLLSKAAKRRR